MRELFRLEISAPVFGFGAWEAGLDFGRGIDLKDDELGSMAAAFAFGGSAGFPARAGGAGVGGFYGGHDVFFLCWNDGSDTRPLWGVR